jgi:SagB-type dehydrogenase family enzyme
MFRDKYPIAWTYHRNTGRWPFNMLDLPEEPSVEPAFKEYPRAPHLSLPPPELPDVSLREALAARLSCRYFSGGSLTMQQISTLLAVAYGVQDRTILGNLEFLERPVPSGGGLYPLELYVLAQEVAGVEPGVYHYCALHHILEQIRAIQLPGLMISELFMGQPYLATAAAITLLVAVVERSLWKYRDRGYRYLLLEAGHVAQNLNLAAPVLGLASLDIGGFFDADLARLLGIDLESEIPLYGVALGVPRTTDRTEQRLGSDRSKLERP